ncbi:unnamed protein product [Prorocentrum cordatum]|uniref:Uncharacterized protein n=1 Tax=Prorocentrum cordatum TaxID=2364126 RepID=A0ABN9VN87_9DINO|nr:unnamed protein product [Polarella glacialis]
MRLWDRCLFARVAAGSPHPVGPRHQPELFGRLAGSAAAETLARRRPSKVPDVSSL